MLVELPILIAVAAKPAAAVVVPLVGEAHGDAVLAECPELLDQAVLQLARPLAQQEGLNRLAALQEFGAIAPLAVDRVGQRDPRRIAAVPAVFGHAHFLRRRIECEGRQRRTIGGHIYSPARMRAGE